MNAPVALRVVPEVLAERLALGTGRRIVGARFDQQTGTVVLHVVAEDAPPDATEMEPVLRWHSCASGHHGCAGRVEMTDPGWR